jgi:predicted nucleic acid-binding protein
MTVVIDASVAAKWLFLEAGSAEAEALLEKSERGELELIAPDLLVAEIASVIWQRIRRGDLDIRHGVALFEKFREAQIELWSLSELIDGALLLAIRHGHSVYDSLYVALSEQEGCELVTADRKLAAAFSPSFPRLRLLGAP